VASGVFDLPIVERKPLRRLAWIKFLVDCRPIHAFIIHATRSDDSMASTQAAQIEAAWLLISEKADAAREPVILLGDFNASSSSQVMRWLRERMTDAIETQPPQPSFNAVIDHIFVRGDLEVVEAAIKEGGASDHPAVVATLRWKENADVQSQ
jgi:endonuclease/exonuclease/phosphatase (EEP) superfamily protein YafD